MHQHRLRRAVPLGALALTVTALAAPAYGAGVPAPGGEIVYNTASVTLSSFPNGAAPITVVRDGVTIAKAVARVGAPGGTPGTATLNVPGLVGPGHILDCWTAFTPDILPGDVITVGAAAPPLGGVAVGATKITVPDFTVGAPAQVGSELVMHGKAADATGAAMTGAQGTLFSPVNRFSAGGKGGQLLTGALFFDTPGSPSITARWVGLTPADAAIGMTATAQIMTLPPPGAAVAGAPAAMSIGAANPGAPGPVPGCTATLGSDAVTAANNRTINIANANQTLTLTGTNDPNVKAVTVNVGGTAVPGTVAGGTWKATLNAANLPDGKLTAAPRFSSAAGAYHGRSLSLVKDTVAPAAPHADLASGTYHAARPVSLAADPGSTIHYTTDGSDPSVGSTPYASAINVAQTETIKAIAVDDAGNAGPVAQFDYTITSPAPSVTPVRSARMKLESLKLARRTSLRAARRSGIDATIYAPRGATVAKVRISRRAKVVQTIIVKISSHGIVEIRLPTSRKARRHLKRGTYRLDLQVGPSVAGLGATTVRTVRIV